jgi:hypothetical protein
MMERSINPSSRFPVVLPHKTSLIALAATALSLQMATFGAAQGTDAPSPAASSPAASAPTPGATLAPATSAEIARRDIDSALLLQSPQLKPYQWFASTDPKNTNADYLVLKPGETKRIPLAAGALERLWSTSVNPDQIELRLVNGREITLLSKGKAARGEYYRKAFLWYPDEKTPPAERVLGAGATLVVTSRAPKETKWFYQVTVRPGARPAVVPVRKVSISTLEKKGTVATGQSLLLRVDAGPLPLVINAVTIQPSKTDLATWSTLRLRVNRLKITQRQDKAVSSVAEPDSMLVDVPLGALAGQFYGVQPHRDAMTEFDGKSLTLYWPMPFDGNRDDAHFEIVNTGPAVEVKASVRFEPLAKAQPFYFNARYGSALSEPGKAIRMLEAKGSGSFVGLQLGISPTASATRRTFAFLEGNETLVADGKSYEGTGTEDFFNSAWYFPDEPFSRPYGGLTYKSAAPPRVGTYRLLIPDAVPFSKSLTFDFEHGNGNRSADLEYKWVAFWYQKAGGESKLADGLSGPRVPVMFTEDNEKSPFLFFAGAALGGVLLVITVLAVGRVLRRKS